MTSDCMCHIHSRIVRPYTRHVKYLFTLLLTYLLTCLLQRISTLTPEKITSLPVNNFSTSIEIYNPQPCSFGLKFRNASTNQHYFFFLRQYVFSSSFVLLDYPLPSAHPTWFIYIVSFCYRFLSLGSCWYATDCLAIIIYRNCEHIIEENNAVRSKIVGGDSVELWGHILVDNETAVTWPPRLGARNKAPQAPRERCLGGLPLDDDGFEKHTKLPQWGPGRFKYILSVKTMLVSF